MSPFNRLILTSFVVVAALLQVKAQETHTVTFDNKLGGVFAYMTKGSLLI